MSVINNTNGSDHTTNCTSVSHNCDKKKKPTNHENDEKLRSYLISTNYDMIAITLMLALYHASTISVHAAEEEQHSDSIGGGHGSNESTEEVIENEESEVYAVLFPWFAEIVGVFVYYILSRYVYIIFMLDCCGVIYQVIYLIINTTDIYMPYHIQQSCS